MPVLREFIVTSLAWHVGRSQVKLRAADMAYRTIESTTSDFRRFQQTK
jgi:hypothetical protein